MEMGDLERALKEFDAAFAGGGRRKMKLFQNTGYFVSSIFRCVIAVYEGVSVCRTDG